MQKKKKATARKAVPKVSAKPPKTVKKKKSKKRPLQHDAEYYAMIGKRGGKSLAKQRGPEYYSAIAKKSHPRKHYNGGRPKGSKTKKA